MIQTIEKNIIKVLRRLFNPSKSKKTVYVSGEELNDWIRGAIELNRPSMVARFGSVELDAGTYQYVLGKSLLRRYSLYLHRKISYIRRDDEYASGIIKTLCNNAGFFPDDLSLLNEFSTLMQEDVKTLDCCCCVDWENEDLFKELYLPSIKYARLEDMEPYDYRDPWSMALKGKKVLVVHPFAKSIESQYTRRHLIWEDGNVLPEFELKTIKAVQTIAGEKAPYENWFEALEHMKKQMDETEYDVAIIGCGAYGFHLAAHAKRTGHVAIHLGGATQILFGIKGKRWEEIPAVSKFFNEHWVNPLPEETPKHIERVEGGCYW